MELKSKAFKQNEKIPKKYSCQGENISPPLEISDLPKGTKSLVLIMDDPDVPEWVRKERIYDHWVVYNIDPAITTIEENVKKLGVMGKNTAGDNKYTGPCPPDREHRYFFKLYALDTKLDLPAGATKVQVMEAMDGYILEETELMGRFEKERT